MNEAESAPYRIAVYRARDCCFALVLGLPGCLARGATEVEAVENARTSIRAYIAISRVLREQRTAVEVDIIP